MSDMIMKIFLTYAGISMFSGLCLMIGDMGGLIPRPSSGLVVILWMGPIMLGIAVGGPIVLWKIWRRP